jgi:hypothetical protein
LKYILFIYFYTREIKLVDTKGNIPTPRAFHSSCLIRENSKFPYLIFYGGIIQNNRVSNEIYLYNITRQEFILYKSELKCINYFLLLFLNIIVPCLFGQKMIQIKDKLIILGGMSNYLHMISADGSEFNNLDESYQMGKRVSTANCDYLAMKNIVTINLIL